MPDRSGDRPQDVGRRHTRRGIPSADTLAILARYRAALREELAETLTALRAKRRPPLDDRVKLWRHARQVAAELIGESDVTPGDVPSVRAPDAVRGRPPRLTARDRAALDR
jgi:hypothetical protein